jgi:translation elongation factor EF-4
MQTMILQWSSIFFLCIYLNPYSCLSMGFSYYDPYRGVIVYFRVVDGSIKKGDKICFMASGKVTK